MSYEGYVEMLCERGHYYTCDAYVDTPTVCDAECGSAKCGKPFVWANAVDETNGEGEKFKAKLEVAEEPIYITCPTCNHSELVSDVCYKIPDDVGHKGTPKGISDMYDDLTDSE